MSTLPYVYAAMLDVLGYRERLERDRKQGSHHFKDVLENALQCLSSINDAEYSHQAISDTIILTCSEREKLVPFLRVLRDVQISFLKNGLFLRGGVTYQQHFRSGAITYSPAYAGAYELENKLAVFPRIVIDHNIVDMFESTPVGTELSDAHLLCECNGVFFVNVIDETNWAELFAKAKDLYENDSSGMRRVEGVFSKHFWFQEYLLGSQHAETDSQRYMPSIHVWESKEL